MDRQLEFDLEFGQLLADRGLARAAGKPSREELLEIAQRVAVEIARTRSSRLVTADDVQAALIQEGYHPGDLGNAAGAIFRSAEWEWTGEMVPSRRVSRHGNLIRVWQWKGA